MVKRKFHHRSNLKIIPFGGVDSVTKNMFVYEFGHDILVVDCGIGFPDEPSFGEEELIIPDFSYLLKHRDKIRGLVITHAHFDHYGGAPYFLRKLNVPIYTSRLTQEFIKLKAEEMGFQPKNIDFRPLSPRDNNIKIGAFRVTPFHINHSVPESLGFCLKVPGGSIFHISDFKFDWTPVDECPFDIQKLSRLAGERKPLLLVSDCLGAAKQGHTDSEATIQEVLENLIVRARGLVLITTVSSNISRIKQAIQAAANTGRKTAFLGRSLEQSCRVARSLGYFASLKKWILPPGRIKKTPFSKLSLIAAGSYGQKDSALAKISQNKHRLIKLKKDDLVIFSADPAPPSVLLGVNKMIDNLSRLGAQVFYYEIQDNLHVSGHATADDIKMLFALVKPQYLLPIGGDFRHMHAYQLLALKMGYSEDKALLLKEKQQVEFQPGGKLIVK